MERKLTPMKTDYRTYTVHDDKNIKGFFGDYRFLSNFEECDVYFDGIRFGSSEAAYMASKTENSNIRKLFVDLLPKDAKTLGRSIELRPNWDNIKYDMMSSVVFDKFFRNVNLRKMLLDTGDKYLEETNHWSDLYWGKNPKGEGENNLGKILMAVRKFWQMKEEGKPKIERLF